jgi:protein-tyrosine sulfotransferase
MLRRIPASRPIIATGLAPRLRIRQFFDRLRFAHLDDVGRLTRRLLRLPSVTRELFFQTIDEPEERSKLTSLARDVRGRDGGPVLFLHGVQPRSGTNFVSSLLAQHPDIVADPMGIHELPLLMMLDDIGTLQRRFLMRCRANRAAFDRYDFVSVLANGIVAAAERQSVPGQRLLFRSPHAHMLQLFPVFFPDDLLIVLMRDGRDVITSTQSTWKSGPFGKTFRDLCLEWAYSAEAALDAVDQVGRHRCRLVRYEDAVGDPAGTFKMLCEFAKIEPGKVDPERLTSLPVKGSSEASRVGDHVSWTPIEKPRAFNPIGRWKTWTSRQHRLFWSIAGEMMMRAGYEA